MGHLFPKKLFILCIYSFIFVTFSPGLRASSSCTSVDFVGEKKKRPPCCTPLSRWCCWQTTETDSGQTSSKTIDTKNSWVSQLHDKTDFTWRFPLLNTHAHTRRQTHCECLDTLIQWHVLCTAAANTRSAYRKQADKDKSKRTNTQRLLSSAAASHHLAYMFGILNMKHVQPSTSHTASRLHI